MLKAIFNEMVANLLANLAEVLWCSSKSELIVESPYQVGRDTVLPTGSGRHEPRGRRMAVQREPEGGGALCGARRLQRRRDHGPHLQRRPHLRRRHPLGQDPRGGDAVLLRGRSLGHDVRVLWRLGEPGAGDRGGEEVDSREAGHREPGLQRRQLPLRRRQGHSRAQRGK